MSKPGRYVKIGKRKSPLYSEEQRTFRNIYKPSGILVFIVAQYLSASTPFGQIRGVFIWPRKIGCCVRIEQTMPDLNFDGHNTLYATHGLHAFAAKCPPQLVKYGLRYYSKPGELVVDPMVGSGTTLVEARIMGRHGIGYEIDPLARLISQVKCREIEESSLRVAYETVVEKYMQDLAALKKTPPPQHIVERTILPDFYNRDYWFSSEVAISLVLLSHHISESSMSEEVRDFLWITFSSIILAKKSVANARDITHSRHHHWSHPQPPNVLEKFQSRFERMSKLMGEFRKLCRRSPTTNTVVELGDARHLPLAEETVDLIFTSPPYATALDYPRAHFLAIPWMADRLGINLEEYRQKASTYIGSERGRLGDFALNDKLASFDLTNSVISQLSERSLRHAKLIQRYFLDMNQVLSDMIRVLKKRRHAIIVVCPSHIRKVEVPTQEVLVEMGNAVGFKLKKEYTRTINERRRLLPYMKQAFGNRMSTEYVLIFQKVK